MNGSDLSTGYEQLAHGNYTAAVNIFKESENLLMIVGVENSIIKRIKGDLRCFKNLRKDGKITAETFTELSSILISNYKPKYKYALKQEQEIYNKLHTETK